MIDKKYKFSEITEKIIGCAMKVHSHLGNGFPELIYQRSLAIEFGKTNLEFKRELEQPVYYQDIQVGTRIIDFLVENKILVELKATSEINNYHTSQIINYLNAYNLEVGLLINFGEKSLKFKRFINSPNTKEPKSA